MFPEYDVIIVGAGHAGSEAAVAAANMGSKVLLATMNMQTIAQMSCNPAMGGVAKGQIVRELDALGAYSGIVTDHTMIQFRMLNKSKRCKAIFPFYLFFVVRNTRSPLTSSILSCCLYFFLLKKFPKERTKFFANGASVTSPTVSESSFKL